MHISCLEQECISLAELGASLTLVGHRQELCLLLLLSFLCPSQDRAGVRSEGKVKPAPK